MNFIYVGIGGFLGSCLRYALNIACKSQNAVFPFGTLLSNIIAGLIIGCIVGFDRQTGSFSPHTRLFLTTGLMGGLSTFSTFNIETADLFTSGRYFACLLNVILNLSLSLFGVALGLAATKALFAKS